MLLIDLTIQFCRYCSLEENLAKGTVHGIKSTLTLLAKRTGAQNLNELTVDLLRQFFYQGKEEHHWSVSSTLNHMKYLKKFFDWCISKDYIKSNPILELKKPKQAKKLPRVLTKIEAKQILSATFSYDWHYDFERYRNYALIAILLYTGVRASELLNLRVEDVNLNSERLFIRAGKGDKQRYVPIYRKLKGILGSYIKERKRLNKKSEFFFTGAQSDIALGYKYLSQICGKISIDTGVKFTPHTLRHTAATEILNQGIDIYMVSKILGHSDIKTTTIYLHTATENIQKSLNQTELY